jgi:hypothetical protein
MVDELQDDFGPEVPAAVRPSTEFSSHEPAILNFAVIKTGLPHFHFWMPLDLDIQKVCG